MQAEGPAAVTARRTRLAAGVLAVLLAAAHGLAHQEPPAASVLDGLVLSGEPGLAALVRQGGRTVFARGYGVRDLRSRDPIGERTGFRLASVTKQFTAAAVMLLVRDGRLRYEDALTDVFPAFPAYGRAITIRHLLTHTSGLPDYEELMQAPGRQGAWSAERQIRDQEVLGLLRGETGGRFAPGTRWAYSNSGYVVLGLVVARVAGVPFPQFLHQRVFRRLRMDRTLAYQAGGDAEVPGRAFGHTRTAEGGFRQADQSATSATLGDGGVYSTIEDLARWDEALRTNLLLSPGAMRPALLPVRLADGSEPRWPQGERGGDNLDPGGPVAYGFGWFLDGWRGRPRQWHHGETTGFRTVVERWPEDQLTVVVLANRDDLDLRSVARRIAGRYLAKAEVSP